MSTNVQLKGNHPADPWFVIEGTPGEIINSIGAVFPDLVSEDADLTQFPSIVAKARLAWASQVEVGGKLGGAEVPPQAPPAPQYQGQGPAQNQYQAPSPAPQAYANAAVGAGVENDRWGNTYQHNHPQAPQTQFGPAVLLSATSAAGKPYKKWIDPRNKKIPSVYASGNKTDPPDLWPGDFARNV